MFTNSDDFRRSVEGAMKLLKAWFSYFQSIFHLARVNHCNCAQINYRGIITCILYVFKYFEEFSNFVEGVVGHMNLWWWITLAVAVLICGWTMHSTLSSGGHNFAASKDMYYELNATIILDLCITLHWKFSKLCYLKLAYVLGLIKLIKGGTAIQSCYDVTT